MPSRIVYPIYSGGGLQGGHKTILRHVEALREMGFEAVAYTGVDNVVPSWFDHKVPVLVAETIDPKRDIVAMPDDSYRSLKQIAGYDLRIVVFVQAQFNVAAKGMEVLDLFRPEWFPILLTVSPATAHTMSRIYPQATVRMVRAFADERIFRPGAARQDAIALSPRKRPTETSIIRNLFPRFHPRHAELPWRAVERAHEREVAEVFGSSTLFLALSRLESLGMTPLEAMACGCVCAGFLGIGGRDFATPENGFWVPDDDCVAAVDALAEAADLVRTGGAALEARLEAGYETARHWSRAVFLRELEAFWMEFAPGARIKDGPLD